MRSLTKEEYFHLGNTMFKENRHELAETLYDGALEINSTTDKNDEIELNRTLAKVNQRKDLRQCLDHLIDLVQTDPSQIHNHHNLSTAFIKVPDPHQAIWACMNGIAECGATADLHGNLALAYGMLGDIEAEYIHTMSAAAIDPSRKYQVGMCMMKHKPNPTSADWAKFGELYSTRRKHINGPLLKPIDITKPGKTVVVAEQGIGDFIMMAPYIWELSQMGFQPLFYSSEPHLCDFAKSVFRLDVTSTPVDVKDIPYCVNMMDLLEFTKDVYFKSSFISMANWKKDHALKPGYSGLIGVNLTGNPAFEFEFIRGIYDQVVKSEIQTMCGDRFLNLEKNKSGSLEDYAKLLYSMKAVITTDTMTAHLAGSLGVPCLCLLAKLHDWRWYHKWYSDSFRTIIQNEIMDWGPDLPGIEDFIKGIK